MTKVDELIAPILAKYAAEVPTIPLRDALRRCVHLARADALSMAETMARDMGKGGDGKAWLIADLREEWTKEIEAAKK